MKKYIKIDAFILERKRKWIENESRFLYDIIRKSGKRGVSVMYIEKRGEKGKKEHACITGIVNMLPEIGITMSRTEVFISLEDEIATSERPLADYDTVLYLWHAFHMDKDKAYEYLEKEADNVYKDKILSTWKKYMLNERGGDGTVCINIHQ